MHGVRQGCGFGGVGLLVHRFLGHDLVGVAVGGFPAVLLLAGNDKDALACTGFAEAGGVEGCDVTYAGLRGGKQAEVGNVPALSPTGATRGLAKYHDVLRHGTRDVQEQADAVVVIGDDQLDDRAGAKGHRGGRQVEHVKADAETGGVYALEELLAGEWAG